MQVARGRAGLKIVLAVISCSAVAAPGGSTPAIATEQNRAALVVDTGQQVKKVCVRFREEFISGAELLRRAEVDAEVRPYAGKGVAVCSLCGVGCRTDDSCLTCDPDGRYWAYSRAPAGTATFRLSPAGASNTEVRNGDVEAWRWSRGTSPGYISVEEVCDGAAPAASAVDTTAPAPTSTTVGHPPAATDAPAGSSGSPLTSPSAMPPASRPGGPASAGSGPRPPSSNAGAGASPAGLPQPDAMASAPASSPDDSNTGVSSSDVATATNRRPADDQGGGSPAGLLVFAGLLAGLLGWAAWARRRRRLP